MLHQVRLSVVVPAFNVRDYIQRSLASLAEQSPPVYEVIVVDDGSTDDTLAVVHNAAATHHLQNLRVIHQDNRGVSAARNAGLAVATGDYVMFLDGDDFVGHLLNAAIIESCQAGAPDAIFWRFSHVDPVGNPLFTLDSHWRLQTPRRGTGMETLHRHVIDQDHFVSTCNVAYRKAFLEENRLRYTTGSACGQDTEFNWKALALAKDVHFIDTTLSFYVSRPQSRSNTLDIRRFDAVSAYMRAGNFLASLRGEEAHVLSAAAIDRVVPKFMALFEALRRAEPARRSSMLMAIERRNPGMTGEIRDMIRNRLKAGDSIPLTWRLFSVSPSLCWHVLGMRSAISMFRQSGSGGTAEGRQHRPPQRLSRAGGLAKRYVKAFRGAAQIYLGSMRLRLFGPRESSLRQVLRGWSNASYSASVEYLDEVARRGRDAQAVLECGSGVTTLVLGVFGVPTWSLEHERQWLGRVQRALALIHAQRVTPLFAPLISYGEFDWYDMPPGLPERFDLVVLDGPPGRTRGGRRGVFEVLSDKIRGATILLDDAERPGEQKLLEELTRRGWAYELHGNRSRRFAVIWERGQPAERCAAVKS